MSYKNHKVNKQKRLPQKDNRQTFLVHKAVSEKASLHTHTVAHTHAHTIGHAHSAHLSHTAHR